MLAKTKLRNLLLSSPIFHPKHLPATENDVKEMKKSKKAKNESIKTSINTSLDDLLVLERLLEYAQMTINEHAIRTRQLVAEVKRKVNSID